ncbi:MAG: thioredoxin family protein [Prolixibacteraceae bacterium]|nr:thioredoxin family protein [Prolixibacteraceae bacterium]
MKRLIFIFPVLFVFGLKAQIKEPVKWRFELKRNGAEAELFFTAVIDKNWHLYDTEMEGEGDGPVPTQFIFADTTFFSFDGKLQKESQSIEHFDNNLKLKVRFYSDKAVFRQKIILKPDHPEAITGYVTYMACDDEECLPPTDVNFSFSLTDAIKDIALDKVANSGTEQNLWLFILISILAGLAAILTPCVFPMIPMTVSFFMRGSNDRRKGIRTAIVFGLSILAIFTLLGALFSVGLFGPNVGNILSTHWIPNLIFFTLFVIFALSFFGLFEIVLPGGLGNKTEAEADKGGFMGAFFMAMTTVIVSFSCTGPFIGALIIEAVQDGGMRPLIGMFFFGLAFAAVFMLLAIFPSALNKLPKSGAWMNSIKIVFAFILFAFSLKFLSNIDQVYGFNIISRDVYLAVWIVLFSLLGLYFLGKIKFAHDGDAPHLSVGRLMLVIATFAFTLYLFTGLLGAPLRSISAVLPPQTSQPGIAVRYPANTQPASQQSTCGPAKYADKLHIPLGLQGYFDYQQGMDCAKEQNKPVFLVFKGHACANCKKMENSVWTDPEVLNMLANDYVIVALYTDDKTTLPESEWGTGVDGRQLKTMGKVNLEHLISNYGTNTIPYHVIIEPDGSQHRLAVTFDADTFRNFLAQGK